jgi:catechol 2,3-dioxygenase-like lactoylglutathione lyase family enzyme
VALADLGTHDSLRPEEVNDHMKSTLDAIGVIVTDMERTLRFYRHLGLEFPDGAGKEGHVEAVLPNGLRIMFDTEDLMRSFDDGFRSPAAPGRVSLAFLCESPAEVDALHAVVVEDGFDSHLAPFDAFWGQRYATILDPDGTHVDLFATLEAA